MRAADRDATKKLLDGFQKQLDDAKDKAKVADARSDAAFQALASIAQQRSSGDRAVATLADPELHGYTKRALGAQDLAGPYSAQEERKIAEAVTQLPLAEKEIAGLKEQVSARGRPARRGRAAGAIRRADMLARNLPTRSASRWPSTASTTCIRPKYRSWKCLWIKAVRHAHLPVPSLDEIKKGN
jgi:hypothetical protein